MCQQNYKSFLNVSKIINFKKYVTQKSLFHVTAQRKKNLNLSP